MKTSKKRKFAFVTLILCGIFFSIFLYFNQSSLKEIKVLIKPLVIDSMNFDLSVEEIEFVEDVQVEILPHFIIQNVKNLELLNDYISETYIPYYERINNYYFEVKKLDFDSLSDCEIEEKTYEIFTRKIVSEEDLEKKIFLEIKKYDESFYLNLEKYYKDIEDLSVKRSSIKLVSSYILSKKIILPQFVSDFAYASLDISSHYFTTVVYNLSFSLVENFLRETNKEFIEQFREEKSESETIAISRVIFRKKQNELIYSLINEMKFFNACIEQQTIKNLKEILRNN